MLRAALSTSLEVPKTCSDLLLSVKDKDLDDHDDDSTKELLDCVLQASIPEAQNQGTKIDEGPQGLLSRTLATNLQPDDDRKYTTSYDQVMHAADVWKVALSIDSFDTTGGKRMK